MSNDTYFVIHFIDGAPEVGTEQDGDADDLHVTFLAHISAPDRYRGELMLAFYDAADETSAFDLAVSGSDRFGRFGQHHVLTLADGEGGAKALHANLRARVQRVRGTSQLQPQYADENYSPHITVTDSEHGIAEGDVVHVSTLTLVRHIGGLNGEIEVLANATLNSR